MAYVIVALVFSAGGYVAGFLTKAWLVKRAAALLQKVTP